MIKTPLDEFINWFDDVPVSLRKYLAHLFRVCTTEDTSQMTGLSDYSLDSFRTWVLKVDFPLRIAARMFYIRSIFDMVILHYKEIVGEERFLPRSFEKKVIPISSKQWEEILESWKDLRSREMSDIYIHSWTSWMIRRQVEGK